MIAALSSAPPASATPDNPELRKAAQAFEAVLLRQLIGTMRKGQLGEDILGSSASATYREMADARTADALAERGAFGIAALIERQFRETSPSPSGEGQRDLASPELVEGPPSRSGEGSSSLARTSPPHPNPSPKWEGLRILP